MKNELAPIVVFVYNRVDYTRLTIEALKNNKLSQDSDLYIYSDTCKGLLSQDIIKVRKYIETIDGFKNITIIKRKEHYGLSKSIINGVTEVVGKFGRVIVLEDDLVTSEYFLSYMNDALNFYKNEESVMHIAGYVHPIKSNGLNDTYFIKPASCWGWATWDRAWGNFKKDSEYYLRVFDSKMIKDFNLNNTHKHFNQIKENKLGKMNTWAVFWYASVYLNDGLSLHPRHSFVKNIGHNTDNSTNCRSTSDYDVDLINDYNSNNFNFTKKIKEDKEARRRFESFFRRIRRKNIFSIIFNKIRVVRKGNQ